MKRYNRMSAHLFMTNLYQSWWLKSHWAKYCVLLNFQKLQKIKSYKHCYVSFKPLTLSLMINDLLLEENESRRDRNSFNHQKTHSIIRWSPAPAEFRSKEGVWIQLKKETDTIWGWIRTAACTLTKSFTFYSL